MEHRRLLNIMPSLVILVLSLLVLPTGLQAQPTDLEEQLRAISKELRCPVCQNLSVADSPSEMAQQMRALVLKHLFPADWSTGPSFHRNAF